MIRRTKIAAALTAFGFISSGGWLVAHAAAPAYACTWLTVAQVSEVLGASAASGKQLGSTECQWEETGKTVLLVIIGPIGKLTPSDRFNIAKTPVPNIVKTPVSGLGDDAVYIQTLGAALDVKKGNFVFQIRVSGFPLEQSKAKEKALAQNILAHL